MIELVGALNDQEVWAGLVARSDAANILQTWEYGEAKGASSRWRPHRFHITSAGELVGIVQVMVWQAPLGLSLAFVNRGPLFFCESAQVQHTLAAMNALRRHFVSARSMYLRIAPAVRRDGFPAAHAGFYGSVMSAWASSVLDLRRDADDIRSRLRKSWRGALSKAERSGASVETDESGRLFDEVVEDYNELVRKRRFATSLTPAFLKAWPRQLPPGRRLTALVVRHGRRRIASGLFSRYGNQAEYLIGCFSAEGRSIGAGQLLVWNAIMRLKSLGATSFDVGGLSADQPGIAAFKTGLSGQPYELAGPVDANPGGIRGHVISLGLRALEG